MEAIGSEVGQKMRSAIKAKLMELGCYVDDELPDYVMVMVANKRTRSQMEEDLQLFLSNNTEAFVSWLHQVLQKLQEVTINTNLVKMTDPIKKLKARRAEIVVSIKKERNKEKEKKKEKEKLKAKEKAKIKAKKSKKDKQKKTNETESIRPSIPPLLMNLEKDSSPSITDVFAGQILKSHGIKLNLPIQSLIEVPEKVLENNNTTDITTKRRLLNRNRFPIIDPSKVSQLSAEAANPAAVVSVSQVDSFDIPTINEIEKESSLERISKQPREQKIKEMNEINAKIQSLKRKLSQQLESGSEDEDFINLRTEAEELMGVDFTDETNVQLVNARREVRTPPLPSVVIQEAAILSVSSEKPTTITPIRPPVKEKEQRKAPSPIQCELPQIELILPKRPLRERLGARQNSITFSGYGASTNRTVNMVHPYQPSKGGSDRRDKDGDISERLGNKTHHDKHGGDSRSKTANKNRLTDRHEHDSESKSKHRDSEDGVLNKQEIIVKKRIGSSVVPLPPDPPMAVASVVRAPPRPLHSLSQGRVAAPQLLLRAVADAHKSLLSRPIKPTMSAVKSKAALLKMRRNLDPKKIIIEVSSDNIPTSNILESRDSNSDFEIDMDTESLGEMEVSDLEGKKEDGAEYVPEPLGKMLGNFKGIDYVPTHIELSKLKKNINNSGDAPAISRFLNLRVDEKKDPQFVVTLDGLDPNIFLQKKLENERTESEKSENSSDSQKSPIKPSTAEKTANEDEKITKNLGNIVLTAKTAIHSKTVEKINKESPNKLKNTLSSGAGVSPKKKCLSPEDISSDLLKNEVNISKKQPLTSPETKKSVEINLAKNVKTSDRQLTADCDKTSDFDDDKNEMKSERILLGTATEFPRKRKASPIVFDRNETKSSQIVTKEISPTAEPHSTNNKYDSLPTLPSDRKRNLSLSITSRETRCRFFPDCRLGKACEFYHPPLYTGSPPILCRAFPNCVFGEKCVYGHPLCKFDKSCVRRDCAFTHTDAFNLRAKSLTGPTLLSAVSPVVASRVVPVSNYKSISASTSTLPTICKFYPNCSNPTCHWFHPKPCRFGRHCLNKIECNFYHHDSPSLKWKSSTQT